MTNKPAFLIIKSSDGLTEYINTNHILRITHATGNGCESLTIKLITGAILSYVIRDSETEAILQQWLDFLKQEE